MKFTQHIVFYVNDEQALLDLVDASNENTSEMSGFLGGRVLRFRDKPGRYVVQADFESWEAAEANNDRPQTQEWAARMAEIIDGDPKYENLDVLADF